MDCLNLVAHIPKLADTLCQALDRIIHQCLALRNALGLLEMLDEDLVLSQLELSFLSNSFVFKYGISLA